MFKGLRAVGLGLWVLGFRMFSGLGFRALGSKAWELQGLGVGGLGPGAFWV